MSSGIKKTNPLPFLIKSNLDGKELYIFFNKSMGTKCLHPLTHFLYYGGPKLGVAKFDTILKHDTTWHEISRLWVEA